MSKVIGKCTIQTQAVVLTIEEGEIDCPEGEGITSEGITRHLSLSVWDRNPVLTHFSLSGAK